MASDVSLHIRRAFTMIEIMVVMLILTMLAAISVALLRPRGDNHPGDPSRHLTRTQQRIIMAAVQEYFNVYNTMPDVSPTGPYSYSLPTLSPAANAAYGRSSELYEKLTSVPSCETIILELPAGSVTRGHTTHPGAFVDAYGQYMDYQPTGGLGGGPVLISGGPDGNIGGEYEADDIRSD